MILFSYDNKEPLLKYDPNTAKAPYVGSIVSTSEFSTPTEIFNQVLSKFHTTGCGAIYSQEYAFYSESPTSTDGKIGRAINPNIVGFQSLFFDIDAESLNGVKTTDYILSNKQLLLDNGVSILYKSPSHGMKVDKDGNLKRGIRFVIFFDRPVESLTVRDLFTDEQVNALISNKKLEHVTKNNEKLSKELLIDAEILSLVYTYYNFHFAHKLGLITHIPTFVEYKTNEGEKYSTNLSYDFTSLRISQKMYGSAHNAYFVNDNLVNPVPISASAIKWIKDSIVLDESPTPSVKRKTPVYFSKFTDNEESVDLTEVDKSIIEQYLQFIPPRVAGTGTRQNYFPIVTACKYLGLDFDKVSILYKDVDAFAREWYGARPFFTSTQHAIATINKNLKELKVCYFPSNKHAPKLYEEHIVINQKYLDAPLIYNIKNKNIFIQSTYKTGKTTLTKELASLYEDDGYIIVFASHLRSILNSTTEKIGKLTYYEDIKDWSYDRNIAITPNSFYKIKDWDFAKVVLIVDEHTQVIRDIAKKYTSIKDKNYLEGTKKLFSILNTTHKNIFMDADDYFGFAELCHGSKTLVENQFANPFMDITVFDWEENEEGFKNRVRNYKKERSTKTTHAIENIKSLLEEGHNIAIPISNKGMSEVLHEWLTHLGYEGILINSENDEKKEVLIKIVKNQIKYRYVIYTYSAWTGFDVSAENHNISRVVALFSEVKGLRHDDMAQAMKRFRDVKIGYVYGTWKASLTLETYNQHKQMKENVLKQMLSQGYFNDTDELIEYKFPNKVDEVLTHISWYEGVMQHYVDFKIFNEKIAGGKAVIETVSQDWKPDESVPETYDIITEKIKTTWQTDFVKAPFLSFSEFMSINRIDKTKAQRAACNKTQLGFKISEAGVNAILTNITPKNIKVIPKHLYGHLFKFSEIRDYYLNSKIKNKINKSIDIEHRKIISEIFKVDINTNHESYVNMCNDLHTIISPYLGKVYDSENEDDVKIFDQLLLDIGAWKKKYSRTRLKKIIGDTLKPSGKSAQLNVNKDTHEYLGDGNYVKKEFKYSTRNINTAIETIGYYINTKRKKDKVTKVRHTFRSIQIDPIINAIIGTGVYEWMLNKYKNTELYDLNQTFTRLALDKK